MTDTTTEAPAEAPTPEDTPEVAADTITDAPAPDEADEDTGTANAEAAKYRKKLREAEQERDALTARLEAVQRQQAEALLGGVKPEALWAVASLPDLLNDEGVIDPDKVAAAVETARERFGIARPQKGTHVPGIGNRPTTTPSIDRWREAFTPAGRKR